MTYWNEQDIFVLGASSGGNVVLTAASDTANENYILPTAVGVLSGLPQFDRTSNENDDWPRESGSSNEGVCWAHQNNYWDCLTEFPVIYPHAVDDSDLIGNGGKDRYFDASPTNYSWDHVGNDTGTPPIFLANAGYVPPEEEPEHFDLSPYRAAVIETIDAFFVSHMA